MDTPEFVYLQNQFLIATPGTTDPYFQKSLVLVCEHDERGAMGLIVNQPMNITIADLLKHMELIKETDNPSLPIFEQTILAGGPVQRERGFVLHSPIGEWQSSLLVNLDMAVTTSRDILQSLMAGTAPTEMLIMLGYASWEAGQLEQEIAQNYWLNCPVDNKILFHTPSQQRWEAAGHLLGIDLNQLSGLSGHA